MLLTDDFATTGGGVCGVNFLTPRQQHHELSRVLPIHLPHVWHQPKPAEVAAVERQLRDLDRYGDRSFPRSHFD